MAFLAPRRFASNADIILASSSALKDKKTSTLSICSSKSKFWSEASPWKTRVFESLSANTFAFSPSRSMSLT